MVMMNIISLLLILCSSTFANAIWGKIIKLPEPPIHKLPGLPFLAPQPITTQKPTQPPAFIPETDPKYCDETEVVKIFSKEQSKKRGLRAWPYECRYPSIVKNNGRYQFMYDIFKCCKKCDYPRFTKCIKNHGSPNWRCPSDGVHCMMGCVSKYGPGTTKVVVTRPGVGIPGIKTAHRIGRPGVKEVINVPKKLSCTKFEKRPDGTTCIRRLCIPLNPN